MCADADIAAHNAAEVIRAQVGCGVPVGVDEQ